VAAILFAADVLWNPIRREKEAHQIGTPQPSGAFRSSLSTDRSPSSSLDYDYNSDWTLCWRDSHPLEWQIASLHDQRSINR
jgi:hypothetical protein